MRRAAPLAALAAVAIACSGASPVQSHETIAEAVAAAPAGGTVRIPAGHYVESITIDRPMTLVAEPGGVHLTGQISVVDASGVTVEGFTIRADGTAISARGGDEIRIIGNEIVGAGYRGIHVVNASAEIVGNEIRGASGPYVVGIHVANATARPPSVISGNVIELDGAYGIAVNFAHAEVTGNTVRGGTRAGLAVNEMSTANVRDNTIHGAPRYGILVTDMSHAEVTDNTVTGSHEPIMLQFHSTAEIDGNQFVGGD